MAIAFLALDVSQSSITRHDIKNYFTALEFEAKIQLTKASLLHSLSQPALIGFAIEHQKTPTTGPGDLATYRAVSFG